ncbi:MAG: hypothetical protein JSR67_10920 [Proteobacteria bacterium]|nr:hypothetical protein [Pseudomonadota bacterium]
MTLDGDERKIATLLAAFDEIQGRVESATKRFEASVGDLDPVVRSAVHEVLNQELPAIEAQVDETAAALERLQRTAHWRSVLWAAGLTALALLITLGGFWLLTPSREEMKQLRAERAQLQGEIDLLESRGGRADFKPCGAGNKHLCVRVIPQLGRFGDSKDYLVVRDHE